GFSGRSRRSDHGAPGFFYRRRISRAISDGIAERLMTFRIPLCLLMVAPVLSGQDALRLSMKRAVELATSPEGNANMQIAGEAVKQAQSRSAQARAAFLPGVDAAVSEINQTRNLAALGIGFNLATLGLTLPTFVGPFNVFDARVSGTQSIFDFSSIRRYQASK